MTKTPNPVRADGRRLRKGYRWGQPRSGRLMHIIDPANVPLCGYKAKSPFRAEAYVRNYVLLCGTCVEGHESAPDVEAVEWGIALAISCQRKTVVKVTAGNVDEAKAEARRRVDAGEEMEWTHEDVISNQFSRKPYPFITAVSGDS